ncbi:MAG: sulfurtransferase complex subunit TusC [Motiliproteus sp.]|nr:sulfurtransferase complex subunit TusC [Motiliproteus sp.]
MSTTAKNILAVMRTGPYGNQTAKEALDAVLTAAAFELPLSLLFMDDGVFQLLPQQDTQGIGAKDLSATLPVLPMYDVERFYVEQSSLESRGINSAELILPVEVLDSEQVKVLFAESASILSF